MPQSLAQIYLHIIFSTKDRRPFLRDATLREKTHAYLSGACRQLDCPSLLVGGVEDHVHTLCVLARQITTSDLVRELKRESSKWIKLQDCSLHRFHWQNGYGVFSVGPEYLSDVTNYIATQEEHHQKESFQDEYRRLLKRYGIAFDERYMWD